jgi:hypothetical protein
MNIRMQRHEYGGEITLGTSKSTGVISYVSECQDGYKTKYFHLKPVIHPLQFSPPPPPPKFDMDALWTEDQYVTQMYESNVTMTHVKQVTV